VKRLKNIAEEMAKIDGPEPSGHVAEHLCLWQNLVIRGERRNGKGSLASGPLSFGCGTKVE